MLALYQLSVPKSKLCTCIGRKSIQFTDPVEVVDDPDFTVIILQMIADVVLFHIRADVLFHLLIVVFRELESALQCTTFRRVCHNAF